jgi:hypothetical protein
MSTSRSGVGDTGPPGPSSAGAEPRWPMPPRYWPPPPLYVGTPHRGRVPGWWLFPLLQLVLLGLLIAQDPGRIDRRSPTLKRLRTALLVVMPAGTRAGRRLGRRHPRRRQGRHRHRAPGPGRGHLGRECDHLQPVVLRAGSTAAPPSGRPARRSRPASPSPRTHPRTCAGGVAAGLSGLLVLGLHQRHAFSPSDTLPVRRWAKLTMMVQSTLSLVIAILVIARAINVLPG